MILLLIFCLCVTEQALPTISRNPFLSFHNKRMENSKEHEQIIATMCWHELEKEASLVQDKNGVQVLYHEKNPFNLGKLKG